MYYIMYNNNWLYKGDDGLGIYNELNLPPFTLRLQYYDDNPAPSFSKGSAVQVSQIPNVWDYTYENPNWFGLLNGTLSPIACLGGNTAGVTNMCGMFNGCINLHSTVLFNTSAVTNMATMFSGTLISTVPLFDTHNVTNMSAMFDNCDNLTSVPLFDTSNVTNMYNMFLSCENITEIPLFDTHNVIEFEDMCLGCKKLKHVPLFDTSSAKYTYDMFKNCYLVESGALDLYNQVSTQAVPPSSHDGMFENCGRDTVTGAAELAQIGARWK